jgi:hypothetical protein
MERIIKINCKESCICTGEEFPIKCSGKATEYHHIKSLGSGGSNHPYNLVPLCKGHKRLLEKIGLIYMSREYTKFYKALIEKKWEINHHTMQWVNYEPEVKLKSKKIFL